MKRRTIYKIIEKEGIALHSGKISKIRFLPSENGIIFYNTLRDKNKNFPIKISPFEVINTSYATVIGRNYPIQTVEHVLAALHGLNITDIEIEIFGDEPPVFDGSSKYFVEILLEAGLKDLEYEISPITLNYPVWVINNDSYLIAIPSDIFEITYSIDFTEKSKVLGFQHVNFKIDEDTFIKNIANARTFGFLEEIEWLRSNNLALGGSLDNSIVYHKDGIVNGNLRYHNEAVRHKVLDLIGDIYLLGKPIKAHIFAHKAGHKLDVELTKNIYTMIKEEITATKLIQLRNEFKKISEQLKLNIEI
ncbi:MAG: UDP-3-O-acyl-N-acetylglucosamine deacetylase [Spirochaetes bacterium]|nr:UDP-3-O-acyl-N-acetylglucosamine deacetylase [Spirochaetota bacterium]